MGLNASKVKGSGPRTPALERGLYKARLVQVIDMGVQPRSFKGEEKEPAQTITLTYELVDEFLVDEHGEPDPGKPRWLSETMVLHSPKAEKATSTKRLQALDPQGKKGGDFASLVGTPVMLSLIENPSKKDPSVIYNKIDGVLTMKAKDMVGLPPLVNQPKVLDLDNPSKEVFDSLPEWIQDKIRSSLEYKGSLAEKVFGSAKAEAKKEAAKEQGDGNPY